MKKLPLFLSLGLAALGFAGLADAQTAAASAPAASAVAAAASAVVDAASAAASAPVPNKGDVSWMLVSTILVIMMSIPGLALFYGGLVRSKNMLSVLMQVFVTFSLIVVLWALYGYSLAFTEGNAFFGGFDRLFLKGVFDPIKGEFAMAATFSKGVVLPEIVFVVFQATFAAITCCLIVGAFAERMKFSAVLLFMVLWFTFSYAPIAHMVWFWMGPDAYTGKEVVDAMNAKAGLIWQWGALDFAGGTVVHINAAVAGFGVHGIDHLFAGIGIGTHPEPHHVCDGRVAEGEPQHHEQQHRRELHALSKGAHDQAAGDCGECRLEHHKHDLGQDHTLAEGGRHGEFSLDGIEDPFEEQSVKTAKEGIALGEGQAVAVQGPQHHDERERHKHLHQHRQHVFAAHQPAVKQGQTRDRHHDHEDGGHQHPADVALVGHGSRGGGRSGVHHGGGRGSHSRRRRRRGRRGLRIGQTRKAQGRKAQGQEKR